MKKIILIAFISIFVSTLTISQGCLPEGIAFTTQEQIDNFQTNYPGCTEIEGDVMIKGDDIVNLNGLNVLTLIAGDLKIGFSSGNELLTNLIGLEGIIFVGGDLKIYNNPVLTSLTGLNSLVTIDGRLDIQLNVLLSDLEGLEALKSVGGVLHIKSNSELINLNGLNSLDSIGGNLQIIHFNNLVNLSGLNSLISIGGHLLIEGNYALKSTAGLNNLKYIGQILQIKNNIELSSLIGLELLESVGDNFEIIGNYSLENFEGLSGLNIIGGDLIIHHNSSLESIENLENVNSIGRDLIIFNNFLLQSLKGLNNIDHNSINNLEIKWNILLSECEVASICNYLANPVGSIDILDNAVGCNSQEEIETACDTLSVKELSFSNKSLIYPNPISSASVFEYFLQQSSPVILQILDLSGQVIRILYEEEQQQGEQRIAFDGSKLKPGIYFCVLKTNEGIQTKKIIKL